MKVKIKAIGRYVIAEEIREAKTDGGIFLPESLKSPSGKYKAIAVGPDCEDIKAGDTFYMPDGTGRRRPLVVNGLTAYRIPEEDILYKDL